MKRVIKLETPDYDGDNYYCYGGARVSVLKGRYDPRQLWLTFDGESIVFRHEAPPKARVINPQTVEKITPKRMNRKLVAPQDCLQPYVVEKGVHQHTLPIEKWQVPSKSLGRKIAKAEYPCFERDEEGRLYQLRYSGSGTAQRDNEAIRTWVNRNCVGRVVIDGLVTFEKADDSLFALVSGNFSKYEQ